MNTIKLFSIALFALTFLCCANPSKPEQGGSAGSIFTDTTPASFEITQKDTMAGVTYKITDVRYQIDYIGPNPAVEITNYLVKYITTTKSCTNCEGHERSTAVEIRALDQPEKTLYTIQHDCDEVVLETDYYKTIKRGCCGAEDKLALFTYNNKQIIAGDGRIVSGNIPNSKIRLLAGYKSNFEDSLFHGTIYFSYNNGEQYEIKISSPPLSGEHCNPFSPEISIVTNNEKDNKVSDDYGYDLWSFDGLTDINKINGVTLRFNFDCEEAYKPAPIEIPLINGKPFGKAEKKQTVAFVMSRK